jgi:hypothetical protein
MASNWELPLFDTSQESAGDAEATPIFTGLFLEYRERAFKRLEEAIKEEEGITGEEGSKDA